ncbi:MAG: MFS transporter [Kiloniellales bacterium]|nr:MFS transporter [Kiloniellales bacterium]
MVASLRSTWALFLGVALIMVASGLQGTLLGVRAAQEAFPTAVTGLIMSAYFGGFLVGSLLVPRMVEQVGHVRVFAALASLASVAVLIHAAVVEPWTWFAMRLLTGFASAGLYVVAESWLNDRATNESRGQVLAVYMIIVLAGIGCGQLLLNVADPQGYIPFIICSVLVSLGLVPLLLSASPAPEFSAPERIGLKKLYRLSPLAVVACVGIGVLQSTTWGLSAVYAQAAGYSIAETTIYAGAIFLGGMLFQWPLGRLSDRLDRRSVLTAVILGASAAAIFGTLFGPLPFWSDFWVLFLVGGLLMPSYSIVVAYLNDWLEPSQIVAASAGLYFVYGLGASLGPFAASAVMSVMGPQGYYASLAVVGSVVGLFALYRMTRRSSAPIEEQGSSLALPGPASPVATELAAEIWQEEAESEEDTQPATSGGAESRP